MRLLGVRLSGFIAWFVWRTLYLAKLVGFGNKIRVVLDWTLDFFVERSSSQIHTTRETLEASAVHEHEPILPPHSQLSAPFPRQPQGAPVGDRQNIHNLEGHRKPDLSSRVEGVPGATERSG